MKTKLFTLLAAVLMAANAMAISYVDLGLPSGTLWASSNIGETETSPGDYYAWGETQTKSKYDWETYTLTNGAYNKLTKYCSDKTLGNNEFTDTKTVLDASDDVATKELGEGWSIPTQEQWQELIDHCTWEWGSTGYFVKSKSNNNAIFLPVSGYYNGETLSNPEIGYYWSSTLNSGLPYEAYRVAFSYNASGSTPSSYKLFSTYRSYGQVIRPVHVPVHTITVQAEDGGTATGGGDYNDGKTATLTATPNAGYVFLSWSDGNTDNPRTVTVTQDSTFTAIFRAIETEYVDLGLPSGTLWATFNVGAFNEQERGDHFAWGETAPKENYSWSNEGDYKWGVINWDDATNYGMTKYNKTDGKTVLDPEDDAAHVNWGGDWRMPTRAEQDELRRECTWEWTDNYNNTGVAGRIVTGSNGNSIFLPAAGYRYDSDLFSAGSYGDYWSSSLSENGPSDAYYLYFNSDYYAWGSHGRCNGLSVRPVHPKKGILTGVETLSHSVSGEVRKVLENGTIYILCNGEKYTIDGRRVE